MYGVVFSDSESVIQYAQDHNLYGTLLVQLKRDFTRVNLKITLNEDASPKELQVAIHEQIYLLLMERFSDYLNLMYAIDIPERAFKDLELTDTVDVAVQVTFLILKRELQKVSLREKYSSRG